MKQRIGYSWIDILVGDSNDNIVDTLFEGSFESSEMGRHENYCICPLESDIVEAARTCRFDIAILVLNNIIFDSTQSRSIDDRIGKCLQLVHFLHDTLKLPVMVLYGYPRDSALAARLRASGAFYAAQIPCRFEILTDQIVQVLKLPT